MPRKFKVLFFTQLKNKIKFVKFGQRSKVNFGILKDEKAAAQLNFRFKKSKNEAKGDCDERRNLQLKFMGIAVF